MNPCVASSPMERRHQPNVASPKKNLGIWRSALGSDSLIRSIASGFVNGMSLRGRHRTNRATRVAGRCGGGGSSLSVHFVDWVETELPSLAQICAVVKWLQVRRTHGPPDDSVPSPDPEWPEDRLAPIRLANVDVLFQAYESETEAVFHVRDFSGS